MARTSAPAGAWSAAPASPAGRTVASHDEGLRAYMLGVYNLMMLGVAFTGAVMLFLISQPELLIAMAGNLAFPIVIFLGTFGLSFFSGQIVESRNPALGHAFFWTYAALWGAGLAPCVAILAYSGQVQIVAQAFLIAASMFGAASLYGYTTGRDLSGWGCTLAMFCWGLLAATLVNLLFVKATGFGLIVSYGVVALFTAVTAFETQMIKDMYIAGDDEDGLASKAIFGAFALYGSFMMIFSRLLRIMWSLAEDWA